VSFIKIAYLFNHWSKICLSYTSVMCWIEEPLNDDYRIKFDFLINL